MPRVTTSGILSIVMIVGWSVVYFSTRSRHSFHSHTKNNYEGITNKQGDYDGMFYPMDDPIIELATTNRNRLTTFLPSKQSVKFNEEISTSTNVFSGEPSEREVSAFQKTHGLTLPADKIDTTYKPSLESDYFAEYDKPTTSERTKNKADGWAWMRYENLTVVEKRNHIKKMMKHAWDNYAEHAWGGNELKPITKQKHYRSVFGSTPFAVTIVDSLDTLHIMGLMEEYRKGRQWVVNNLNIESLTSEVSVFETNIRLVGGLLSCYALTGESVFRDKARQIADKLLPSFNTATGIPHALVDFDDGSSRNYGWAYSGSSILSEFGTLHLEFAYLSDVTGNPIYRNKTERVRRFVQSLKKPDGLYPNYLNPTTGKWGAHDSSMGSLGDSFYEYLLKAWLQYNKDDAEIREMFDEAMQAVLNHMLQTSPGGLVYFAQKSGNQIVHRMEHLACFSGGLLALAAETLKNELSDRYLEVGKGITRTCHESYDRSFTKLGPEVFRFSEMEEANTTRSSEQHYILRPEVVESYFYLYRITKDEKYRDWGWEAVEAFERHCRVDGGYTGIRNVYSKYPMQDDVQQSFFLSETLKYLYLLFSDDTIFSLDEWVFNTEAHPLPIKGVNPYYREAVEILVETHQ